MSATANRLETALGSEADQSLKRTIAEKEREIDRFDAERAGLDAGNAPGLSAAEAHALSTFVAEVRAGIAVITTDDWHRIYALLKQRGRVRLDADGAQLGPRHRLAVDWEAVLDLPFVDNGGQGFRNPRSYHAVRIDRRAPASGMR